MITVDWEVHDRYAVSACRSLGMVFRGLGAVFHGIAQRSANFCGLGAVFHSSATVFHGFRKIFYDRMYLTYILIAVNWGRGWEQVTYSLCGHF